MLTTRRLLIGFAAMAAVFFYSGAVEAQPAAQPLSERGYEQLRGMSSEIDRFAQGAANPAQRSRSYAYDRDLQRAISNFARRAHAFDGRLANYRLRPWQLDTELTGLAADARSIEARLEQSRRRDPRALDDWKRTAKTLEEMVQVYREDGTRGSYRDRAPRDERRGRADEPAYRDDRGIERGRSSIATLVSDVSERANRLSERAKQLAGAFPVDQRQRNAWLAIQKLAQDASALGVRIDRDGEPRDLRSAVAQLNAEASEADRQMKAGNVFPEIKGQWADLMQSVGRLQQSAGGAGPGRR
jgi:hypothetical protein